VNNKKIIKTGIIGSGFAADFHYEALKKVYSAQVHVIGVFSPNIKNSTLFADAKQIKAFDSLDDLINECDVLHLCTPPSTHEELTIQVLHLNKFVIIEKPFTGYFGDQSDSFSGFNFPRKDGLEQSLASIKRMLDAEKQSKGAILYAENWIYTPAIQKEKEVIEKTNAQVLWIQAQQSHSGSHSLAYGKWHLSGGGSLIGKGSHPIAAALYLKQVEGLSRNQKAIRPKSISARTHHITKLPNYIDQQHLKTSYTDVEDYANVHIEFEDGTIADIIASELTHGGVKNYVEVNANNHRTICNITPNNAMQTYNPVDENFKDIYVVEKTGTKQGWSSISPDEAWFNGYRQEMEAFYNTIAYGSPIESNSQLAADVINIIYTAYLSAENHGKLMPITLNY
jgi:predicted dehydrogenase